jgi:uncharacterized protein (DUF849 family)
MSKLILQMRANEFAMRTRNPHVPFTPDEIAADSVACRDAGASAYHFHGRTPDGAPDLSDDTYHDVMGKIRAHSDILVHASLGAEQQQADMTVRMDPIRRLAQDGLAPDLVPLDMGSSNFDLLTDDLADFATWDNVYANSTRTLRYFAGELRKLRVKPELQIWNIPNMRLAGAFHRLGFLDGPLWASLALSGGEALVSHPGTVAGLEAFLTTMPDDVPVEWSVLLYHGDLFELAPMVIERGGHIAIGIGDHHYTAEGVPMTNAEVAARIVAMAAELGREVATPDEARAILSATP